MANETEWDAGMDELVEACRRGNVKALRALLAGRQITPAQKDEALKTAAEFGHPDAFEAVLMDHGSPDDETLLHAAKWALRYHDRRILGLIMQADTGRWALSPTFLNELRAVEAKRPKPDAIVIYLIDRAFSAH